MRLSKKTFCYSVAIAALLTVFIILYFALMLPSLYVDYMQKDNLDAVVKLQKGYMKTRSYENLSAKNIITSMSAEIPYEGDQIYLSGKAFKLTITVNDQELRQMLEKLRAACTDMDAWKEGEWPDIDTGLLKTKIFKENTMRADAAVSVDVDTGSASMYEDASYVKFHHISEDILVFEGGVVEGDARYTNYVAAGKTEDALILSYLPAVTPQMKEIRPIVFKSLPMITAVIFLLTMIASQFFSKRIVNPVIRLANYTQEVKIAQNIETEPLEITGKDEIAELGSALNELYERVRFQYRELEQKNLALEGENKRQEIFLRASSHQLKTPVTAALLLVEGMIDEIGKYKDMKKYLPEVKAQLLSMQRIVGDILSLNHCAEDIRKEAVDMRPLIEEVLGGYQVQISEQCLEVSVQGSVQDVWTDEGIMRRILDNLIANAIAYTPEGGQIVIRLEGNVLKVYNHGAHIDEALLPHIYEPFVSSDTRQKGRGMGLYIVAYYASLLGCRLQVNNAEDGVVALLVMEEA